MVIAYVNAAAKKADAIVPIPSCRQTKTTTARRRVTCQQTKRPRPAEDLIGHINRPTPAGESPNLQTAPITADANVTESAHQRSVNHKQCQPSCDNQIRTIQSRTTFNERPYRRKPSSHRLATIQIEEQPTLGDRFIIDRLGGVIAWVE